MTVYSAIISTTSNNAKYSYQFLKFAKPFPIDYHTYLCHEMR